MDIETVVDKKYQKAGRFMELVETFRLMEWRPMIQGRHPNLRDRLTKWYNNLEAVYIHNRSGGLCRCLTRDTNGKIRKDARFQLPKEILTEMFEWDPFITTTENGVEVIDLPWKPERTSAGRWGSRSKVTVTWIGAYLAGIFPDTKKPGWENFGLSHCCIGAGLSEVCLTKTHFCWESDSDNQSRGYEVCWKVCHHCATAGVFLAVCYCQQLHDPPCC